MADTSIDDLLSAVRTLSNQIDMGNALLEEVIERTQNFREGFFAMKLTHQMGREIMRRHMAMVAEATGENEVLEALKIFAQDLGNLNATIMTHIDRLDS